MALSGLYIVVLSNEQLISVNAQDRRIADRCLQVNFENCKVGKAKNFQVRERNYWRTFGKLFVTFERIALTEDLNDAERIVLSALRPWRVRSPSGRRTEWLAGIDPHRAVSLSLAALRMERVSFQTPSASPFGIPVPVNGPNM